MWTIALIFLVPFMVCLIAWALDDKIDLLDIALIFLAAFFDDL